MGKGNGSTRASSSTASNGLTERGSQTGTGSLASIRRQIQNSIAANGANWGNRELVELRSQEEAAMRRELKAQTANNNNWRSGFLNITRDYEREDTNNPIKAVSVSVNGNLEEGNWYQVRVGGASVSSNENYSRESGALWNNDKRFATPRAAMRWAESQAERINRKYRGKI